MNVPNHEKKPFREMTPEERSAIVDGWVNGELEVLCIQVWRKYVGDLCKSSVYRTRPRQLIIPWEVIKPEYKWAAMNDDEKVWFFSEKPRHDEACWLIAGTTTRSVLIIDTTGIDWRESLVQRPDGV